MVEFDAAPGPRSGDMTATQQQRLQSSIVLVLDDSAQERHYSSTNMQNGVETQSSSPEGLLSREDIDLLLTMFGKGASYLVFLLTPQVITSPSSAHCLAILSSNNSQPTPPPILFLIALSPQSLSPTSSPHIATTIPTPSDTSSRSSTSHKKHPQSDSSDRTLAYGPEFVQLVSSQAHYGLAHVLCVALCRQGDSWNLEDLTRLGDWGIGSILSVPCEQAHVSGLYMVGLFVRVADLVAFAETGVAFVGGVDCHCAVSENEFCADDVEKRCLFIVDGVECVLLAFGRC